MDDVTRLLINKNEAISLMLLVRTLPNFNGWSAIVLGSLDQATFVHATFVLFSL